MITSLPHRAWECLECGKRSSQRSDLRKHIEDMHLNLKLPCDICGDTFKSRHHRNNHMRNRHGMSFKR